MRPQQGKELEHFIVAFARDIKKFSSTEKAKYSLSTEPGQPHERFLDEKTLAVISKSLEYTRNESKQDRRWWCCYCDYPCCFGCRRDDEDPYIYGSWMKLCPCVACCCKANHTWMADLPKILLMHRQMEPLLRLASHPEVRLERCFQPWGMTPREHGWEGVLRAALSAYIGLNVLFLKPETWPSRSQVGTSPHSHQNPRDYRLTAMYGRTVYHCTATRIFDVQCRPHRLFFGVPQSFLRQSESWRDKQRTTDTLLLGRFPLSAQFEAEVKGNHVPTEDDVYSVRDILWHVGMPKELVLDIMDFAEYEVQARLKVLDDPLHPDNSEELYNYLSYCWRMLVQCEVLADVCGKPISWENEVRECILHLFFDYPDRPEVPMTDPDWNLFWSDEWIGNYRFQKFI
ncbi:hypothetical protein MMC10_004332 [Thelotrema lepadinum]|nr:hypothetical protein [Thelotrema lepadinum]